MKTLRKVAIGAAIVLLLTVPQPGFAQETRGLGQPVVSLESLPNPDGMLNIKTGFGGSLNATSWQTATDVRAYPRFAHARGTDEVPSNSLSNVPGTVPDDFYWDSQFGLPGVSGTVNALAISGNDVYVGGSFTMAGSGSMSSIAKWNGSSWSALGSGVGGVSYPAVNAVAVSGNDVYVGAILPQRVV